MISFWDGSDNDLLWDTLIMGGVTWPGIASVEVEKSRDIDEAKTKGKDGITLTDNGFNAAKVNITLKLWLASQWLELQSILPKFDPKITGGSKTPVDIIHPTTQIAGVKYIYIKKVRMQNPDTNNVLTVSIETVEWFPKTKDTSSSKKPKGLDGTDKTGGKLEGYDVTPEPPSKGAGKKL